MQRWIIFLVKKKWKPRKKVSKQLLQQYNHYMNVKTWIKKPAYEYMSPVRSLMNVGYYMSYMRVMKTIRWLSFFEYRA